VTQRPEQFQELLLNYALERFFYRLSKSQYSHRFVLKGGLMLLVWQVLAAPHTRDIALLGELGNGVETVTEAMKDICRQEVEEDGLVFDATSVSGEMINPRKNSPGVRVRFKGYLEKSVIDMFVDVSFGDVVLPEVVIADYPTILDFPRPRISTYTRESLVAEKLEAMISLGEINSRMQDFFDVWVLSRESAFAGKVLAEAVKQTFANRGTASPPNPACFSPAFSRSPGKQSEWQAFVGSHHLKGVPDRLEEVVVAVQVFAGPLLRATGSDAAFEGQWPPGGPWLVRP
jgi:predicted nucleotidyltransferase component of viral defense system